MHADIARLIELQRIDSAIHAAERANELVVREGIPFREAYRRVGAALATNRAAPHQEEQDPS